MAEELRRVAAKSSVPQALPMWIFGALFLLYAATAMPGLGWRDAPEFADSAYTLGIAHPAGFPTFSQLAKIFIFLPIGSIPFRVTLAAAFFQVMALYLMFRIILGFINQNEGETGPAPDPFSQMAAGLATIALGLTPVIWTNATGIEVYGLNLLFLAMILACAVKWVDSGQDMWLYTGGLVYGLSAGNHATVAFFLPGLLLLVLVHSKQYRLRRLLFLMFYFFIGFSVYLYLPIRAQTGPSFDFGHPINLDRFWWQITDQKDAVTHFEAARGSSLFFYHAWSFLRDTVPQAFWFLGLPFFIIGVVGIWRRRWTFVLAAISIALFNMIFFIEWTDPVAFLPAWFLSFIFIGVGLAILCRKWAVSAKGFPRLGGWIAAALALFIICIVGGQYPDRNRSKAYLSVEAFRGDFESLPPDAICLTAILPFHHESYRDIFRMRPDVSVLILSDFNIPEVFNPITADRFPLSRVPSEKYSRDTGVIYLKKFLAANLDDKRDIFWQPNSLDPVFELHLKPSLEMLFQFSPTRVNKLSDFEAQAVVDRLINKIRLEILDDGFITNPGLHLYYLDIFFHISNYLWAKGNSREAMNLVLKLERLLGPEGTDSLDSQSQVMVHCQIGKFLFESGRWKEAEVRFRQAVAYDPYDYLSWAFFGRVLLTMQRREEALYALNKAVEIDAGRPEAVFYLGEYYRLAGQQAEAKKYYLQALSSAKGAMFLSVREAYRKHFVSAGGKP